MRVTILGCGGAGGVPMIGNRWGDCDPKNPRNRRSRASILVEDGSKVLLVDTGPDLRRQLLDAGVERLDGVLYTHTHADHTHGIDELRALNRLQGEVIDLWGTTETLDHLMKKFPYVFEPPGTYRDKIAFYKPCLAAREFRFDEPFDVNGVTILPFEQDHGFMATAGFRFGDIAYSTDLVNLTDRAFEALSGVKVWILGCLQEREHPTHVHLSRALEWVERVGPERTVLTHLSHRLDYAALAAKLPDSVVPAHDGMVVELDTGSGELVTMANREPGQVKN